MKCIDCSILRPQRFKIPELPPLKDLDLTLRNFKAWNIALKVDPDAQHWLQKACESLYERLQQQYPAELDQLADALDDWMTPVKEEMQAFLLGLKGKDCEEAVRYILNSMGEAIQRIDLELVETTLSELFDQLLADLTEMVNRLFDEVITPAMDDMIEWLQSDYLADTPTSDAFNRFMLAKDLEQLKKKLGAIAQEIPAFSKAHYFDPILDFIQNSIYLNQLEQVSNIAEQAKQIVDKLLELNKTISDSTPKPGSGPGQYLWYASWASDTKLWNIDGKICQGPLFTIAGSEAENLVNGPLSAPKVLNRFVTKGFSLSNSTIVQLETAGEKWIITDNQNRFYLQRKNSAGNIKVYTLFPETDWRQVPPLKDYTFKLIDAELADNWAYYSSWLMDMLNTIFHSLAMEPTSKTGTQSNAFSNFGNALLHLIYGNSKLGGPKGYHRTESDINLEAPWAKSTIPLLTTLLASLEGRHRHPSGTKAARFNYWFHQAGIDVSEKKLYDDWLRLLREALLSYLTLINYQGPAQAPPAPQPDPRPLNRRKMPGVSLLFAEAAAWLTVATSPQTAYGFPQGSHPDQLGIVLLQWLGMGTISGVFANLLGLKVAENIAGAEDARQWCASLKPNLSRVWTKFPIYWYLANEGATHLGRNSHNGMPMTGYAKPETSPYKLPYPNGQVYQCVQGNRGLWGHNAVSMPAMLYAYDFALDFGDSVVATRKGILWAFSDQTVTDAPRGCYVQILHNGAVDEAHDRNQAKQMVHTIAEYRHGIPGSISATLGINIAMLPANVLNLNTPVKTAFEQAGVKLGKLGALQVAVEVSNASSPIGPVVIEQGQQIMQAGVSGLVAFNHLHFHVQPALQDEAGDIISLAVGQEDLMITTESYTIPVVFQEVEARLWAPAGVARSRHYYQSANDGV